MKEDLPRMVEKKGSDYFKDDDDWNRDSRDKSVDFMRWTGRKRGLRQRQFSEFAIFREANSLASAEKITNNISWKADQ